MAKTPTQKNIDALTHDQARRINNPTAEMASLFEQQEEILGSADHSISLPRARPLANGETRQRDGDLDPQIIWNGVKIRITKDQMRKLAETGEIEIGDAQLVWKGKDSQDWSDLVVNAPPIYRQEAIHPRHLIDDLRRRSDRAREEKTDAPTFFSDFNGITDPEARAEFYQHPQHWTNRFILGDSLQVMASLAEREAMRGKVQCIYFDPPYGIKFNSNWQVSTLSRDVKDGKATDVSREPEQVKAFRDTWKDGIHSYLTYLRDRVTVARELLSESGSVFVQIGDENVHRVRALMDEVFGEENYQSTIYFVTTGGLATDGLSRVGDYVIWYAKNSRQKKFRPLYHKKRGADEDGSAYKSVEVGIGNRRRLSAIEIANLDALPSSARIFRISDLCGQGAAKVPTPFDFQGRTYHPTKSSHWKPRYPDGLRRAAQADRIYGTDNTLNYVRFLDDYPVSPYSNFWDDTGHSGFAYDKLYVVQTGTKVIERCILMTTDPGDLVLDPTCGSGTTATVAEQWGRRWITIDTSRVALALARTRLMSARYPYYHLADSTEGRAQEQKVSGKIRPQGTNSGDIRQGFVYERAPHITLKSIANNAEIDVIWEKWQAVLEALRTELNAKLSTGFEEWQIPRDLDGWLDTKEGAAKAALVSARVRELHKCWWEGRIARQKEIDASIAKAADVEMLYDRPYEDKSKVRVAGPFTVESLSPHRVVTARDDTLSSEIRAGEGGMQPDPKNVPGADFGQMVLDHLRSAGVHQQEKRDTIHFNSVEPWPGNFLAAEGRYNDGDGREKRAGILIGPEFGTLTRSQITAAAREASDARFDALIACAFNFEAQASDLNRLGPLAVLKARMNPDLHMAEDLKNTGKGNLFVVFGEPDVDLIETAQGELQVKVNGIDIFDPSTGEIRSDDVKGIAAWFIDTDYNEESFFVRHAYFLGANDPYKSLKTALKAEIDEEAWQTLYSDISRPFPRPSTGRIAVKVINHFGDEVLKVFGV
ncbi:site-specific DNA-methyltransferase [Mesorhizobium sp. M7A.F.Ca.US.011.01.1.1]|uniref:site-specific DNA-methyltransferase n=1 Tax=Mesorhizobium sp. M7A.F.Ca.US.011.01.1.1 TaxID=2496741 RepID=UPI000FCA6A2D|nr:site-specific DNA-methyltransferase [Mesorhizobium sp. M7A.F.Ca.US.011.01.1.1]RUX29915.1 site-specific DNA-methyltransferase [Mesorhizobium sp. M7A.F.Ca.US.011.01.1.1]